MGSICFSSASILRCTPLSDLQSILLIIPTALEVIFSTSLIFVHWNGTKKHLLLTAEGWIYLILSLIELIRTIVPGVRDTVSLFQVFDIGIGVTSFLPIFFYTFFLFLFTSNDLVDVLPKSIRNVAKLSLILFLPAIIVFNEVASFVGVKIDSIPPSQEQTNSVVAAGFTSPHEEQLWTFFTSTTLALLVVYQAAVFCFSFFRLARAIIGQRRIEKDGSDQAHFINGMGWLCAALKLGALESVVGFAGGGFGVDMTRRVMRMMARACLCIGIVKGVDTTEDFHDVQRELKLGTVNSRNKNGIQNLISNPRLSTFRRLSPTATAFHATATAKLASAGYSKEDSKVSKPPHYSTWTQRQSAMLQSGLPGMKAFANVKEAHSKQRVTVLYQGGTPRLHMRFSSLDVLNPVLAEKIESRPPSQLLERYQGRTLVQLPYVPEYAHSENDSELQVPEAQFRKDFAGSDSHRDSIDSAPSLGPYEIVDARKLPQRVTMAQIYLPPSGNTQKTASRAEEVTFPKPTYQMSPAQAKKSSPARDVSKIKSVISVADSIQAVRELTGQFPGPPGISQLRPAQNVNRSLPEKAAVQSLAPPMVEKSVWEEDSRTSAQYLSGVSGLPIPQVIGSPSQLSFFNNMPNNRVQSSSVGADENFHGGVQSIGDASSVRAGKVAVTPGGYSRMSTTSRHRSRALSMQSPVDPFTDDLRTFQLSKASFYAPVGTPLRQSLKLFTALPTQQPSKGGVQPLTAAEVETPSTAISQISRLQDTVIDGRIDPFVDFATALDTGKSRLFRPSLPAVPEPPPPQRRSVIPTPTRHMSTAEEKLSRIAKWVDTSANLAVGGADMPVTPVTILTPTIVESPVEKLSDRPRENNLQNLHDRGTSIDALSILWPKGPNTLEGDARRLGGARSAESAATRPQLTRITTVGKAPSRTTPAPMHIMHALRGSLHLQPIVVPPRSGNLPEVEYESMESPIDRNVMKDSDVLAMEDSLHQTGTRS